MARTFGDVSDLTPFVFVQSLNVSVLSSLSSPLAFPQAVLAQPDSQMASASGAVYDPSNSSGASFVVGLSVEGLIANNGTVVPLPDYMQVFLSNASISLAPDRPTFFMVLVNTTSMVQDGTYKIAIAETLAGGQKVTQPIEVIIETQMQTSMGSMVSMGM